MSVKVPDRVDRGADRGRLRNALRRSPIVLMTGPRQAGKTTLARELLDRASPNYFDLEDPSDLARLAEPMLSLGPLRGLVVIDEAQRVPELFPILRVLADRENAPATFLVLGSASPGLVGLSAESLAGRVELLELGGLRVRDLPHGEADQLWLRGAFPRSYLSESEEDSVAWRESYARTFLERDLGNIGVRVPATTMRRFWTMVAHYHGQTWNGAELARSLDVSQPTIRRYLDHLTDALVVRQLQPWHTNIAKREVRSPKVYVRDSGVLHQLLGITTRARLEGHPKLGASWEGFVVEQISQLVHPAGLWFWGTRNGAELDVVVQTDRGLLGIEIKRTARPALTKSMRAAQDQLQLAHLVVVHAGVHTFPLSEAATAMSAEDLLHLDDWHDLIP